MPSTASMKGARYSKPLNNKKGSGVSAGKIFNPRVDYDAALNVLLDEFNARWKANSPSPDTGLQGYEDLAIVGSGSFGTVKLCKDVATNNYHAVKVLIKEQIVKTKQVQHVFNEKCVLAAVKFPFLVGLTFSSKDNDNLYLGMPFINGGELFRYHRKVRKFNEKQARFYAGQVCLGLEYLHYMKLLYRDLKPENLLICANGYIKLTDFGFTKKVETRTFTLCGTPEYLAPEIIQSKPYSVGVDWWAFGILLYEFVAGSSPFSPHNRDVMVMYSKIIDGEYRMPETFSKALQDLINNLLQNDMSKRFGNLINGTKDIKYHEWFRPLDWYSLLNQDMPAPYLPNVSNEIDLSNFDKFPRKKPKDKSKVCKHCEIFMDF